MKDRFNEQEWELLKFLPFQAFKIVAGADGKIDDKEANAFLSQFTEAAVLRNPLHRALMVELASSDMGKYLEASADIEKSIEMAELIKPILREQLAEEEYQNFVRSVFISMIQVANASGGGFFRKSAISDDEKKALAVLASVYDIDMDHERTD